MNRQEKKFLNRWYKENKFGKITAEQLIYLSKKTDISIPRIHKWIKNKKRYISVKRKNSKYLNEEQNEILRGFYNNKTNWPTKENIKDLAIATNKSAPTIKRWFNKKRYDEKNHNI